MPDFRRGAAAIAEAQKKAKQGGNRSFTPEFYWKDGDERYVLILNEMDEITTVDMISFIPVQGKKANGETYERFDRVIARTSPVIGETVDPMERDWDGKPRETSIAVAVELEPTFEEVRGRKRPTGFAIKTREFERRIRDDEGDLTDEYEDVVAPEIGFIHGSPHNFFNVITSYDANEAPIDETPVKILRVGSSTSTAYTVTGYPELEVDLSVLVDNLEGISYLSSELDEVLEAIDANEDIDDKGIARIVGTVLLDKHLLELVDKDRYDRLYNGITKTLDPWSGDNKKGGKKSSKKGSTRRSQRRSEESDPEPDVEASDGNAEEASVEEKPKRTRAKKADAPATREDGRAKIEALREKAERRRAGNSDEE